MPELSDFMYCSEQICIPPTFPYLLRQYAKAAIRSQPSDLLKWSTAYFRCLSLGVPPPVKPRLEYPIPRDYHGLTPGWLKALLYQLQNNQTVHFKILWDRWIGACLIHETLVQILCLGGFNDNTAVPWLKFIALCAGFLTDCLTQTMILICEILTEEPEGGSAMIPLEVFLDLYKFLAKIDASQGQWLPNIHFTDAILNLYKKKAEEEAKKAEEEEVEKEVSQVSVVVVEEKVEEKKVKEVTSVISCPSIHEDGYAVSIEKYLQQMETEGEEGVEGTGQAAPAKPVVVPEEDDEPMVRDEDEATSVGSAADKEKDEEKVEDEEAPKQGSEGSTEKAEPDKLAILEGNEVLKDIVHEADATTGQDVGFEEKKIYTDTLVGIEVDEPVEKKASMRVSELKAEGIDLVVEEDLARLREMQREMYGETDDELEKLKRTMIGEIHRTRSDEETLKHYDQKIYMSDETPSEDDDEKRRAEHETSSGAEGEQEEVQEKSYEMIYVNPVPGIGAIVPDEMIEAVCNYMKEMARDQHGVVMPRNIRHYKCPPLEVFPTCNNQI